MPAISLDHSSVLDARHFMHNKLDKTLCTEHSDIDSAKMRQLFDESFRVGYVLHNPKTNSYTRWYLLRLVKDDEGDLQETILAPCSQSIAQYPTIKGYTMVVFND
jgi:hypothetical protein